MTEPKPLSECEFKVDILVFTDKKNFFEKILFSEKPMSSARFVAVYCMDESVIIEGRQFFGREDDQIKILALEDFKAFAKRNGWENYRIEW